MLNSMLVFNKTSTAATAATAAAAAATAGSVDGLLRVCPAFDLLASSCVDGAHINFVTEPKLRKENSCRGKNERARKRVSHRMTKDHEPPFLFSRPLSTRFAFYRYNSHTTSSSDLKCKSSTRITPGQTTRPTSFVGSCRPRENSEPNCPPRWQELA